MKPDWDKLGGLYKNHRSVLIADVDCTIHQGLCGKYGVQGYPTIKFFMKDGSKQGEAYNGGRDFNTLKKFAEDKLDTGPGCSLGAKEECSPSELKILEESEGLSKAERSAKVKEMEQAIKDKKAQAKQLEKEAKQLAEEVEIVKIAGQKPEMVEQLLDDETMTGHCEDRTCIIVFLEHILDSGAKSRNDMLKMLTEVMKKTQSDGVPVGFMWSEGGAQFEAEEKLSLQFGFPAAIAINLRKGKFGIHRGVFTKQALEGFTRSPRASEPIPKGLKFAKVDAWDGKDGALPEEDL